MADNTATAVQTLQKRASQLTDERDEIRRRVLEAAYRYVQVERDIAGCSAGARALGHEIEISNPALSQQKFQYLQQFNTWCQQIGQVYPHLKTEFGIEESATDASDTVDDSSPEMPRIQDIIADRLKTAGDDGALAADIRRFISKTYKADFHDKTVSMTLNRMRAAGLVRRDGYTWYLVPSASMTIEVPTA